MPKKGKKESAERTARHLAVLCLVRWDSDRNALQHHLDTLIFKSGLRAQDRQLGVMLVQGVLRQKEFLDRVIAGFSRFPLAKMKALTIMTLRVGVFQLLCLDRIPDSAAVNETVKILRHEKQPRWLINFVNGVLRTVARNKESIVVSDAEQPEEEFVANHPEWLVRRWQQQFGQKKTRRICAANNLMPEAVLRVNTQRTTTEKLLGLLQEQGHHAGPGRYAPDSIRLESFSGSPGSLPGYADGFFHVQDESAQLVSLLLGPFEGTMSCLDACAGLGGKTCHLAQLMEAGSRITAVEPSGHRFTVLGLNIERLRLTGHVQTFQGKLDDYCRTNPEAFDRILVDAPCSGTGVLGRHPDIRWNRQPDDLQEFSRQQLLLLRQAASLLKDGGVLVYATCSLEPEENQQVVALFLQEEQEFQVVDAGHWLPEAAGMLIDDKGFFCPTPAEGLDGFFGARLVRKR